MKKVKLTNLEGCDFPMSMFITSSSGNMSLVNIMQDEPQVEPVVAPEVAPEVPAQAPVA